VLKLSRCWSRFLVHFIPKLFLVLRVVVLIVRIALLGLLLGLCFRLALAFLVILLLALDGVYRIFLLTFALFFVGLGFWWRLLG
jgi:hypothetical protein